MTRDLKNDRWTCPNDRNLQLRSKLNAGWSIHTGKRAQKKDLQLTENELLEIQKVLQRSEALERNERERVLKMVDRLENLKRNASQANFSPSQNRCGICGDYFCLIRASPNLCASCQRVLCNKCSIDTPFNYEDYMNTSSSNGATNSLAQNAIPGSRRSSSVSLTGAGGNYSSNGSSSSGGASSGNGRMYVYLCRLCSEQREFLKKSGVWFLRKYPNYLLNADKFNSTSNINQMERVPSSASKTSLMSPLCLKRNLSTSSSNSSSFRFWKNLNMQYFQNETNAADNVSDLSNEIDPHQLEMLQNNYEDQNYQITNPNFTDGGNQAISNDLIITNHSTQSNHNIDGFYQQNQQPFKNVVSSLQSNIRNVGPQIEHSTSTNIATDSFSSSSNSNYSSLTNEKKTSANANYQLNSGLKDHSYEEDDEESFSDTPASPNMTNYNYYSNIITNMNPTSTSLNLMVMNQGENLSNLSDGYEIGGVEKSTSGTLTPLSSTSFSQIKPMRSSRSGNGAIIKNTSLDNDNSILSSSEQGSISISNKDFENGTNTKSNKLISASVSDLEINDHDEDGINQNEKTKSDGSARNVKKNKGLEWCSTQLSMEESNSDRSGIRKSSNRLINNKLCQVENQSLLGSTRINRSMAPKISSQTVNNLAKKILSQNSSIVSATSNNIAASSSSAVSSASSIASGFTKLSFK